MSTRQQRREVAEMRRKVWRLQWIDIGAGVVNLGGSMREALEAIARDADRLVTENPQQKSEIFRALEEFTIAACAAILKQRASAVDLSAK